MGDGQERREPGADTESGISALPATHSPSRRAPAPPRPSPPRPAGSGPGVPRPAPEAEPAPPSSETPPTRQVPKSDLRQLGSAPPDPRPRTDSDPEDGSGSSWPGSAVRERIPADSFLPPPFVEGQTPRRVGRCEIHAELAQGGMATVYLGRWVGAGGS